MTGDRKIGSRYRYRDRVSDGTLNEQIQSSRILSGFLLLCPRPDSDPDSDSDGKLLVASSTKFAEHRGDVGFSMNGSNSSNAFIVGTLNGNNQYTSINQSEMWNVFASMYDPTGDASPTTPWIFQWASGTNDWWGGTATASGTGGKKYWSVPVDVRADNSSTTWRVHYEDMNNTTSAGSYFPPKNQSPVYDARGNMTFDGYLTYTYDAENRLIKVTDGLLNWHFLYDPWGRRISQRLEGWFVNSSGNWQFRDVYFSKNIYEGWNLILEDVIDDGASSSDEKLFYWGLDISNSTSGAGGIGGLIMTRIDSNNYMVGFDGSGNVINLVDMSTHAIEAKFEYDAFGQVVYQEGAIADKMPFRYQTKWSVDYAPTILLDDNGGGVAPRIDFQLYDYGLRWYHADQGRFINRDPIGESGGLNLYAFVGNDPVNFSDILGMNGTSNSNQAHNYGNYHCGYEHMARHDPDCQVFELDPFEVTTDGPSPWEATRGTEWSVADFNRFSSDTTTLGIGSIPGGTSGGGSSSGGSSKSGESEVREKQLPPCSELRKDFESGKYRPNITAESFIPGTSAGPYHGDNRGFLDSPSTNSIDTTSRISVSSTYYSSFQPFSSTPEFRPSGVTYAVGETVLDLGVTEVRSTANIDVSTFNGSIGNQVFMNVSYSGANPLSPPIITPSIRMNVSISINFATGQLTGSIARSSFPAAQIFLDGQSIYKGEASSLGAPGLLFDEEGQINGVQVCDPSK